MSTFFIKDCALIVQTTPFQAVNLRELRECIRQCEAAAIYHHFYETLLRPTFDDPVYQNDFAIWADRELNDIVLAERLGIIDPYQFKSIEDLRLFLLDILDDRLSEVHMIPWARSGHQFYFIKAITVVFDTGRKCIHPDRFLRELRDMSLGSIYYHFIEASRREPMGKDDFSSWLKNEGEPGIKYLTPMRDIRRAFLPLADIKARLIESLTPITPMEWR